MKVIKRFYSLSEKKKYNVGDTYDGKQAKKYADFLEKPKRTTKVTKENKEKSK